MAFSADPLFRKLMPVLALCLAFGWAPAKELNIRLEVARQLAEKGEYEKAVEELKIYLGEHPDSPEIYARIGAMRMKQGNFKMAGENYKIALAKDPKLTEAREGLANAYEQAGDKAKAEEERKKLPAAKPSVPAASAQSAPSGKEAAPKPASANSVSAAGKDKEPPAPVAAGDEGFLPALDSVFTQGAEGIYAQKDFLDALEYYRQNKPDAMAPALRRCLARQPGHPGAYYLGGLMRYEKGDYAKASFNFKRSFAYPARGFNSYFYLGRIYQRQQRVPEAIAAYEKYLSLSKSGPGRKQAEAYLAQLSGGKKENQLAEVPEEKGTDSAKGTEPTAKAAAEGPQTPVEAAKALILGRDGSFFYLIPDKAAPSGKNLQRAYDLCRQEKFEKAVNTLKETVLNYGGSDNAQAAGLDLASVYLRLGLWENARDRIKDYLGNAPRDSLKYYDAAQYLLALANLGLKDGEQAEKALLKTQPGNPAQPQAGATGPSQEEIDYRLAQASSLQQDSKKQSGYMEKAYANSQYPARRAELAQKL
ncbi:MAG: tetratricopeptide repeat protein, partial [Fibrobacteria bacterium]